MRTFILPLFLLTSSPVLAQTCGTIGVGGILSPSDAGGCTARDSNGSTYRVKEGMGNTLRIEPLQAPAYVAPTPMGSPSYGSYGGTYYRSPYRGY
jgi:hypothetical protein